MREECLEMFVIGAALRISAETPKTHLERNGGRVDAADRAALVANAVKLG